MNRKLKIFLCDLTHDTMLLVSDTIPINIGYIASYCKHYFKNDVDIELFKFPTEVIEEIKKNPPDVIGLSNYSWNSNLSELVAGIAKVIILDVLLCKEEQIFHINQIYN